MYIIAGLGNPGREYEKTRHNVGFDTIDILAEEYGIDTMEKKHKAIVLKGMIEGEKVLLVKPQTYMNLSGESIRQVLDFYKLDERKDLIVLSDDISLDVGKIRVRKKGSAGGHNGLKNIISHLGHDTFMRVKIGVGEKPKGADLADHVLGRFSKDDRILLEEALGNAAKAVVEIMKNGPDAAMNKYNGK